MVRLPKIARRWLLGAAARVGALSDEPDACYDRQVLGEPSEFSCELAMFRRAAEPLDGVHPDLAHLLAHNRDRDICLNEQLTRLADETDVWRAKTEASEQTLASLKPRLASVRARAESAEAAAGAARDALHRLQLRYVAFCANALNSVDADLNDDVDHPDTCDAALPGEHDPRIHHRRLRLAG